MLTEEDIKEKNKIYAQLIEEFDKVNDSLIEQFHSKKFIAKGTKFYPSNKKEEEIYLKVLFRGKREINSWDTFPCTFKSRMEDAMCKEIESKGFKYKAEYNEIYYSLDRNNLEIDEARYKLSNGKTLTESDIQCIKEYANAYVVFLKECVKICNNDKDLAKEAERVENVFATCNF